MNNNLQVFNNQNLGLKVRTILNEDNSISINAEDTAIGFGWYEVKNNQIYVRWRTINKYLSELCFSQSVAKTELEFSQQVGKDDYIPESLFYLLAMKASNENALDFQKWLAVEVIPSIRKTGTYTTKRTPMQLLELEFQAIKEVDSKVEAVKQDLEDFKQDMPLLGLETDRIKNARNRTAVRILGGKESKAYQNRSLRGKVYQDLSREVNRQFGVDTYKAIKRKDCDKVIAVIEAYIPPMCLANEIESENLQLVI